MCVYIMILAFFLYIKKSNFNTKNKLILLILQSNKYIQLSYLL